MQYGIHGRHGELWRVDFAWPDQRVAAEYDSIDWHVGKAEMLSDKKRFAGVQELAWTVIPIVVDDVRRQPRRLADRINYHLSRAQIAS